jgi:hypothetical protein
MKTKFEFNSDNSLSVVGNGTAWTIAPEQLAAHLPQFEDDMPADIRDQVWAVIDSLRDHQAESAAENVQRKGASPS